jgi:hypothetical protein
MYRTFTYYEIGRLVYQVFRKPCLPEDEGRSFFMGQFATREECEKRIERELTPPYWRRSDFKITRDDDELS